MELDGDWGMSPVGPSATWQGTRTKAAVSPTADILALVQCSVLLPEGDDLALAAGVLATAAVGRPIVHQALAALQQIATGRTA